MTETKSPKKLTYIVNYLSAEDAQHYVHVPNLLTELEGLGWQADLVSERGGSGEAKVLGRRVIFLSNGGKLLRFARLARQLIEMRQRGCRLVFVRISKFAALLSAILGRLFGWKTIYWLSGAVEDFNLKSGFRGRLSLAGMYILLHAVDRLATGPETMVDYYCRLYRLPRSKILLLYNDVDLTRLSRGAKDAVDEMRVLLVHRLSPVRETDRYFPVLLEVMREFARVTRKPIRLDICGDGPERPRLEALAASEPDVEVHFHGAIPQQRLGEYYDRATIFVLPSYREGFPRVMLEAMAHGLPVVATDAGGTRDLCGSGQQAFVIDRDDSAAFGEAVKKLLHSRADRDRLSLENRKEVERFDSPAVARMYDRALSKLINAQPA